MYGWVLHCSPESITTLLISYQFSSVAQSCLALWDPMDCSTPGLPVITNSQSLPKLTSIKLVMPSNHLILCCPLLFPPSIFLSIRVFSNQPVLHIRWPKYWSLSFSISPSNEYSGLTSFRMDWLDLLAVQGTLKSLLQHHSSKANRIREVGWGQLTNDLVCYAKVFLSQKISRPTDIENKLVVASGDREWMGSNIGLGE